MKAIQAAREKCSVALWICLMLVIGGTSPSLSSAQQSRSVFQGTWTASVGSGDQVFRGTWSAEASPQSPNSLHGSWTLLNDAGELLLQGTWSARKSPGAWQGTWSARAANGASYSGSWAADLSDLSGRTFEEMLKRTVAKQVAGSWRSGRYQGFWWLNGSQPKPARH